MYVFASFWSLFWITFLALGLAQLIILPSARTLSAHLGLIAIEVFVVLVGLVFIRLRRLVPEDIFLLNATLGRFLLATVPTAICASLLIADFDQVWRSFLADFDLRLSPSRQRDVLDIQILRSWDQWATGLLAVAFFPAICEELFFRGFIFTNLYGRHGPKSALVGSALLFGLAHFNPIQLPTYLLLGLFFALLTYWSHSIYPAILAHLINNLISVAEVNLSLYGFTPYAQLPWPVLILAALGLVVGIGFMRRQPSVMPLIPSFPTHIGLFREHAP